MTRDAGQNRTLLSLDEITAQHIRQALEVAGGKINGPGGAAQILGLHPNTLRTDEQAGNSVRKEKLAAWLESLGGTSCLLQEEVLRFPDKKTLPAQIQSRALQVKVNENHHLEAQTLY